MHCVAFLFAKTYVKLASLSQKYFHVNQGRQMEWMVCSANLSIGIVEKNPYFSRAKAQIATHRICSFFYGKKVPYFSEKLQLERERWSIIVVNCLEAKEEEKGRK